MRVKTLKLTESAFTRQVLELAKLHGWRTAHFRPARTEKGWRTAVSGNGVGFPDLVMIRGGRLIFAELKTDDGKVRDEQADWIADLSRVPSTWVVSEVWRPSDWDYIVSVLTDRH